MPTASALIRGASFYRSNLGNKLVMAITGFVLFLFVIEHLAGNLLIYAGASEINSYAAFLERTGDLLWAARAILLTALMLHIISATKTTIANWRARPTWYVMKRDIRTNYAARTMIVSGPLVLLFVIYHVLQFDFLVTGPGYEHTNVYRNMVLAFRVPYISAIYILANLSLGAHLWHGGWSMLHTVGISNPRYGILRRIVVPLVAAIITTGFISIPIAALAGALPLQ